MKPEVERCGEAALCNAIRLNRVKEEEEEEEEEEVIAGRGVEGEGCRGRGVSMAVLN
jgi:hypothetical protein